MVQYRDIQLKRQKRLDVKQDKRQSFKATIVDNLGNASGSGSVWADQATRRVWVMPLNSIQPFQVLCVRIPRPTIGLGVVVGYVDHLSNTLEVLRTDYEFYQPSNTLGNSWEAPDEVDFSPGGRLQLWIASKMLTPLSTYPDATGLVVNVVGGDYPYLGERKTFAGQVGVNLSAAQPSAGQYRFVGLYLDANNTLQTVNGTAGSSTTPAEPTWPNGAFRLSVVRLYNPQTSVVFAPDTDSTNDVFDRRMLFSDEIASRSNVWPMPDKANIAATEYDTLLAANSAAVAGELIRLGEGDFVLSSDFSLATHIAGSGRQVSIIGLGNNVDFTDAGGWSIQDVAIDISGSTTTISLVDTILMDCILGNMPITLDNCFVGGGEIYGNITCLNTPYFDFPLITGTVTGAFAGYYLDVNGNIVPGVGWPFDKILTVSTTDPDADYTTIAAAIAAASAGEAIWLDAETFTETITVNKAITIFSTGATITSSSDFTVTVTAAAKLFNLTITNSGTGAVAAPVHLNGASSVVIDNCTLNKSSGAATIGAGLYTSTSSNIGVIFRNTRFLSNAGTTRYGIYNTIFTTGTMYAGEAGGTNGSLISTDVTPSILVLDQLPLLQGAISFVGAVGWYNDINGNIITISSTIDLNGVADALILDADQDTTISAPTDDQIDFEAGGADVATLTASGLALASGARLNEFSTDGTMAGDSDTATPTEKAVNTALPLGIVEGRLTLTTAVPVTTSDVTAATTLYFTPFRGNRLRLYNGSNWTERALTEISASLSGLTANTNYDVFVYDNSGTLTLDLTAWTNDTTRATALTTQDGVYVKSGATARRYLGTIRITGTTGQCEDSVTHRYVWNYYNRQRRPMVVTESTSHTYNTASWRAWNNVQSAADVECVVGVVEDSLAITSFAILTRSASNLGEPVIGVGLNSTASPASNGQFGFGATTAQIRGSANDNSLYPRTGYNFIVVLEIAAAVGAGGGATFNTMTLTADVWG